MTRKILCDKEIIDNLSLNIVEKHTVDFDDDGVNELAALHQANNFAEFYFFKQSDCGYKLIENMDGTVFTMLSYSSSSACYPIGCLTQSKCRELNGKRVLQVSTARNSLSPEERKMWDEGKLDPKLVSGVIKISDCQLIKNIFVVVKDQYMVATHERLKSSFKSSVIDGPFDTESCGLKA